MSREWVGVPEEAWDDWREVYLSPSEGHMLTAACPNCGATELRRYYDSPPGTRGGLLEWCGNCLIYEHASAIVPDWWQADLFPDTETLKAEPEALENAHIAERD